MPAKLLKPIARAFMRILFRVRVVGGLGPVHLGGHGAERVLIIANHESFLDGVILALFLPADPVFVVHTHVAERTAGFASGCAWSIFSPWTRRVRWPCDRW